MALIMIERNGGDLPSWNGRQRTRLTRHGPRDAPEVFRHRLARVLRSFARPSTATYSGLHGIHLMDANRLNANHRWRHFAQGTPLSVLAMMYNHILRFAVGILVARVIGASQYGVVNVARNILEIFGIVSPLGLDLALQRHLGSGQ